MDGLLNFVQKLKVSFGIQKQWRAAVSMLPAQAMLPWIFTRITHHLISG